MIGTWALVMLLVVGVLAVFAISTIFYVRRLMRKLGPEGKPTVWTYINEFGGYIILGVIFLIGGVVAVISEIAGRQ